MDHKVPPGKRVVAVNAQVIARAHMAAYQVLRDAGEQPISMLVLAARIIKTHAGLAGTPVEATLETVHSLIDQIDPVRLPDRN